MKEARRPTWSFVVMRGADKSARQFSVSRRSVVAMPLVAVLTVTGVVAGLQAKAAWELKALEKELAEQTAYFTTRMTGLNGVIDTKDDEILILKQEIMDLSRQSQETKQKVEELQELEDKLKLFIETYGGTSSASSGELQSGSRSSGTELRDGIVEVVPGKTIGNLASGARDAVSSSPRSDDAWGMPMGFQGGTATQSGIIPLSATGKASSGLTSGQRSLAADASLGQIARLAQQTGLDLAALGELVDAMEVSMEQTLKQAQHRRTTVDAYPSLWPTKSKQLTSGFGYRRDPFTGRATFHAGIDINGKSGDAVFSAADGTVSSVGYDSQYGNYVAIDHLGGLQTIYMHLQSIAAAKGDDVVRGEKIGTIGSSGRSTGAHLHFQIMQSNQAVNPLGYLHRK